MTVPLRVGTRASTLARAQTERVARSLRRLRPRREVVVVPLTTEGDRIRRPGSSPDFTGALEAALRARRIDLVVHSTKDLPAVDPKDLVIAAYPRRADPRDCWVGRRGRGELPPGARVGTSSARRRAQLARWRPDLRAVEIRGNVDGRLSRLKGGEWDAVLLAKAGIDRLGRSGEISGVLSVRDFLPPPGQGALALQARREDRTTRRAVARLDHHLTRAAVEAERAVAALLGASCDVPLGSFGTVRRGRLRLTAEVLSPDGARRVRASAEGPVRSAGRVARSVARRLEVGGARLLLG